MTRILLAARIAIVVAGFVFLGMVAAVAQERQFTITVPESQLNYIGKILGKQPYEDTAVVLNSIQSQVNAQLTREAAAARDAERERIRNELKPAPSPPEETKP